VQPRAIIEQAAAPGQSHRLLRGDTFTALADGVVSTSIPRPDANVAPWHGYYTLDTHATARLADGLDANLELVAYQLTASGGYHNLSGISPGFAAHWYGPLFTLGGRTVHGDLTGLELGELTVGHGLLVERTYAEGAMGRLVWGDWQLEHFIAGQTAFVLDDLFSTRLSWRDVVRIDWLVWPQYGFEWVPHYLSLSGNVPCLGDDWRIAWEAAARVPIAEQSFAAAGLVRVDWLPSNTAWAAGAVHLGYQGRVYQRGYGPWHQGQPFGSHNRLLLGTAYEFAALPWREDTYATNALDYLAPSALYHQWSHTVMLETRTPLSPRLRLDLDLEGRAWFFDDPSSFTHLLPRSAGNGAVQQPLLPNTQLDLHYRAWLVLTPFVARPHRLRLGVANTYTRIDDADPSRPTNSRLDRLGWFINLEMEVYL
jgi:hypothetical protein